jgi:membrane protein CcdC involved in cytochrome C biogenesis
VQVNGSLSFDELCHACQFGLHVVEVLLDGFRDEPDFMLATPIFSIRSVSMMVAAMLSLVFFLTLNTQSFRVSHAKVSDLLVVFAAKADWILVSGTIHGLLIIRIPLAVQILLHNDYALGVELFWRIKIILTKEEERILINTLTALF